VKNLPNALSVFRILLVPILVTVLFTKVEGREWYGLALFLGAALTDFLDGYLARKFRVVSRLGQLLDPAADKILMASAFVSLVELNPHVTPAWMVAIILAREFAVGALRNIAAAEGKVIAAGWAGKVKTTVQIVAVSLLIIHNQLGEFRHLAPLSLWIAVFVTVFSGFEYFLRYRAMLATDAPAGGTPGGGAPA
jgi:CDP-diacylglycerol--glycerol-3-phosphate 3-phosphatidyltransferase